MKDVGDSCYGRYITAIRKKYHSQVFTGFAKALNKYGMLKEGDTVLVYMDGTAESVLLGMLFRELIRHGKFEFKVRWFADKSFEGTEGHNLLKEGDVTVEFLGYEEAVSDTEGTVRIISLECYEEVIAHFLKGFLEDGRVDAIMPLEKKSDNVYLIRPFYNVRRSDIERVYSYSEADFLKMRVLSEDMIRTMNLIEEFRKGNKFVETNIFAGMENVNKNTLTGYIDDEGHHSFLEWYDKIVAAR